MNTNLPKVMQPLGGHTLISHVIKTAKTNSKDVTVVVEHKKDLLKAVHYITLLNHYTQEEDNDSSSK